MLKRINTKTIRFSSHNFEKKSQNFKIYSQDWDTEMSYKKVYKSYQLK